MKRRMRWWIAVATCAAHCASVLGQSATPAAQIDIRITAPTMVAALLQFSEQTGIQLVFPTDGAADITAPRVVGTLTPRDALDQLLRGSGLRYEFVNVKTVSVSRVRRSPNAVR